MGSMIYNPTCMFPDSSFLYSYYTTFPSIHPASELIILKEIRPSQVIFHQSLDCVRGLPFQNTYPGAFDIVEVRYLFGRPMKITLTEHLDLTIKSRNHARTVLAIAKQEYKSRNTDKQHCRRNQTKKLWWEWRQAGEKFRALDQQVKHLQSQLESQQTEMDKSREKRPPALLYVIPHSRGQTKTKDGLSTPFLPSTTSSVTSPQQQSLIEKINSLTTEASYHKNPALVLTYAPKVPFAIPPPPQPALAPPQPPFIKLDTAANIFHPKTHAYVSVPSPLSQAALSSRIDPPRRPRTIPRRTETPTMVEFKNKVLVAKMYSEMETDAVKAVGKWTFTCHRLKSLRRTKLSTCTNNDEEEYGGEDGEGGDEKGMVRARRKSF